MKTIQLNISDTKSLFNTLKEVVGGTLNFMTGETEFQLGNFNGEGYIRGNALKNGITFLEFDLTLNEEITIIIESSIKTHVNFIYCTEGCISHAFGTSSKLNSISRYQTSIVANTKSASNILTFKKGMRLRSTLIAVNVNHEARPEISKSLKDTFIENRSKDYFYNGSCNFKIAEMISQLSAVKNQGIVRRLLVEGFINVILALEIEQYNFDTQNSGMVSTGLLKSDLVKVKELTDYIENAYDTNLQIAELELIAGLSAAKLQEGFKFLHGLTICEYIRTVRLLKAEKLINRSDMNISEIVYAVGFTSRSYFSKIFKEKFNVSPTMYKKQHAQIALSA